MNWENLQSNTINDYIIDADFKVSNSYNTDFLDVNETITELSYLTHDYFRYYGKFPSKIAKYIIDLLVEEKKISADKDFIFDNYNGSGTTMVEAKIAGFSSGGIDINPFGVLAANVKTYNYDVDRLRDIFTSLLVRIKSSVFTDNQISFLLPTGLNEEDFRGIAEINKQIYFDFPDVNKWFDEEIIHQLSTIKYFLLSMPQDRYREFFTLGFFSIIRRVSKAHDAEVRPHVNLKKRKRNAVDAFEKKVGEMLSTMSSWNTVTSEDVVSQTIICNNSSYDNVRNFISELKTRFSKNLGLVVSHPPYLNCFDYIPVYKLKFLWAFGFDEIYGKLSYQEIKSGEIRSYPATSDSFINNYFKHNFDAYKIIFDCLRPGGYCCVVIGDCTIKKELFSVHKMFIHGIENIGFVVERVTYRSTAYGVGRYAYRFKADYTDKEDGKQDAIIFFKKPIDDKTTSRGFS